MEVVPSVLLHFWIGRWRVVGRDGTPAGSNLIESVLDDHAVLEHWRGVGGDEGKSVFFVDPASGQWKQIWLQPGCVKKKLHDPAWTDGVRFVGTAFAGERRVPDRTTLWRLDDGNVRQLIEQAQDGATWRVAFDAVYERVG